MSTLNKVILVGRVGKTPEVKFTPAGKAVASFSLALQSTKKGDDGRYESDWFDCTAWGVTAEFLQNYVTKGQEISVDGRLEVQKWVDKATGGNRTKVCIVADRCGFIGKRVESVEGVEEEERAVRPVAPAVEDDGAENDPFADEA